MPNERRLEKPLAVMIRRIFLLRYQVVPTSVLLIVESSTRSVDSIVSLVEFVECTE